MPDQILVLDSGTTSTRAIVFGPDGSVRGTAQKELTQHYPRPGWVEHDAQEIWRRTLACAQQVVAEIGADRIAANGDVANKIGTYALAVLAQYHNVKFMVAAPQSTIDWQCQNGDQIPIEQRPANEVSHIGDKQISPQGVAVSNPAFDVTPAKLITAIVTETGVVLSPSAATMSSLQQNA